MKAALGATLRRGWSRPWLRRTVLALVAGGTGLAMAGWGLQRAASSSWAAGRLDTFCREQTGLSLRFGSLDLHPLEGRVRVKALALGGDLLQVEAIDLRVRLGALVRGQLVIESAEIQGPKVRLDAGRLAVLRLKPTDPTKPPLAWEIRQLTLRQGRAEVAEPAWGLPRAWADFSLQGQSLGPRRLRLDLMAPRLGGDFGGKAMGGRAELRASLGPEQVKLRGAEVTLGPLALKAQGDLNLASQALGAQLKADLDLEGLEGLGGLSRIGTGRLEAQGSLGGTLANPTWRFQAKGPRLALEALQGQSGELSLKAEGHSGQVRLDSLRWITEDGSLEASGELKASGASHLSFRIPRQGLGAWAGPLHLPALGRLVTSGEGSVTWKGRQPKGLDQVEGRIALGFQDLGQPAGKLEADLSRGVVRVRNLDLQLPEAELQAGGTFHLGPKGVRAIEAEGRVRSDAAEVARALKAWQVTDLDMSGRVETQAKVTWTGREGFSLQAGLDIESPRWHGATVDRLRTQVSIANSELQLSNVVVEKDRGEARGELWLSWADLPKGHDQIDFCFRARDLPIREGLGAADLSDLDITGLASGWVRARGPYTRMKLDGSALTRDALVYGVSLPVLSADFSWDLEQNRMWVQDLRLVGEAAQLHREEGTLAGGLDLGGQVEFDFERMRLKGRLKGEVETQKLGFPGPRFQARLEANLDGQLAQDFGPWGLPEGRVTLRGGRLFLGDQSLEGLEGTLEVGTGTLDLRAGLQGFSVPLAHLNLMTEGKGLIGALDLKVDSETVNTQHLAARLSRDLLKDGQLALQAEGRWSDLGWDWRGRLESLSGQFKGFELTQPYPSELRADDRRVEFDLNLEGKGDLQDPAARGARLKAVGELPFLGSDPLRVHLEGETDLGALKTVVDHILDVDPFSMLHQLQVAGAASLDVTASGTYADPRLDGDLKLRGGRFSTSTRPQSLEDVSLDLRFQGQEVLVAEEKPLRGRLAQGDLKAWGRTRWQLDGVGDYEVRAQVDDFQLRDLPEGFELQGSVDATLSGKGNGRGLIKGALTARRMSYRAELNLGDFILNNSLKAAPGLSSLDPQDLLTRIDLDLDLRLLQPWKFDTNLLKLEGQTYGGFKVQGTLAKPGLWGRMEFIPGGLITNLLPAGDIKVERGYITFTDPRSFNPFLNVEGQINISPYLVNLNIRGTIDSLDLRPTSTPSLRQDEIIAILLDPGMVDSVGTGAINTQSAVNTGLAQTTSSLITTLALANLQEGLRRTLNLDRVSFAFRPGGAGTSESTLSVGKSLELFGRRMPVLVSRRTSGELITNSVQVEWRFGNLVLQLGASQTAPEAAGIAGEIRHTWSPK